MFKRSKSGVGRRGNAGPGMETWKLAAIVATCIVLAMLGGFSLELGTSHARQSTLDLGFDLPNTDPGAGGQEGHG